ncbi:MAG: hemerythrin [Chlorobiaceae bacterium]|nr:hemerythrin [Chlorobiaceae bacterium]
MDRREHSLNAWLLSNNMEATMMNKAIDDLMHEHEAILEAFQVLKGIVGRLEDGGSVAEGDISDILGFLKLFADGCHHGKEEQLLFPALVRVGLSEDEGPLRVLLSEHDRGRELLRAMEASSFPRLDPARFSAAVHGYIELFENHIRKENTILFPMTQKLLTGHQFDEIAKAFDDFEGTVIGEGRHEELHALLTTLRNRYALE